jgi:hypothetical protein
MNNITKHVFRFLLLAILQVLILNQLEFGFGIHIMILPLFVMLLPFEISIISTMSFAFLIGFITDIFSNTYGLHASSLLMMAYFRPILFKKFAPTDGYDPLKEANIFDMGIRWFFYVFGSLLLIHHFWYFLIEIFRINEFFLILKKTIFSSVISFLLALVIQILIIKKGTQK